MTPPPRFLFSCERATVCCQLALVSVVSMKSVVAVAAAAAASAPSSELLCVLFQIMELRNARLEGNETAFVRVQIDKVAQVRPLFF
jgi:hypothetical protein